MEPRLAARSLKPLDFSTMESSTEWSLPAVHDVLAGAVPDRDMIVWNSTRRTYGEVAERSRGLASFLVANDVGLQRDRDGLERWECGQDPVALVLRNCPEYLEAMFGCYRARAVPFNVNHHYKPAEVAAVFNMIGPKAVIYHRSLGPLVEAAWAGRGLLLIDVDDGSGVAPLSGSVDFETAAASRSSRFADAVAGRPLHGVHRRHDGLAQGSALASGRHLRVRDGWE